MRLLEAIVTIVLVAFSLSAVLGYLLERPIFVSYVTSDSMSPTLERGDVFFINPLAKPGVGDIVVFNYGGRWTVHRVIAVGDTIVTKGDANVAADSPVPADSVAGVVVTLSGVPLKIPKVGNYIAAASTGNAVVAVTLFMAGALLLSGGGRKRRRKVLRLKIGTLMAAASALLLAMFVFSTLASWGTVSFSYASTLGGGQREGWYLPGSEFEESVTIRNRGPIPMHYVLHPESERASLEETSFTLAGEREVKVRVSVPQETRIYSERIDVYAYPPLLPLDTVVILYDISPYVPLLAMLAEVASLLAGLLVVVGGEDEVMRIKMRWTRWIR